MEHQSLVAWSLEARLHECGATEGRGGVGGGGRLGA